MINKFKEFINSFRRNDVILDKSALLNPFKYLQKEKVYLDKLGGYVWVREITAREQMLYNQRVDELDKSNYLSTLDAICYLVSLAVCDETGQAIYTEADVQKIRENSIVTVLKLHEVINRLKDSERIIKNAVSKSK